MDQLIRERKEDAKAKKQLWKHDDQAIGTMVKGFKGMKFSQKAKYVTKKNSLVQIVGEIEKWQARYDPTWILIMQMSLGKIDKELHEQKQKPEKDQIPIISAAKGIRDATRDSQDAGANDKGSIWVDADTLRFNSLPISYSSTQISYLGDEKEMVIIDVMICNPLANANRTIKEVRNLARILAEVEPSIFGLLKCKGVIKLPKVPASPYEGPRGFKFIFGVPRHLSNPQSLRAVLQSDTLYPLDERLELAKRLASSILFIHTVHFVHKNIRPETIIIFENDVSEIGAQFLAGFEEFRLEDGVTHRAGDGEWEHNLCEKLITLLLESTNDTRPTSFSSGSAPRNRLPNAARHL